VPATFLISIFFKDKLFVPVLAQIYENETYFPLQFIDLKNELSGWHRDTWLLVHYVEFWESHVENH